MNSQQTANKLHMSLVKTARLAHTAAVQNVSTNSVTETRVKLLVEALHATGYGDAIESALANAKGLNP